MKPLYLASTITVFLIFFLSGCGKERSFQEKMDNKERIIPYTPSLVSKKKLCQSLAELTIENFGKHQYFLTDKEESQKTVKIRFKWANTTSGDEKNALDCIFKRK